MALPRVYSLSRSLASRGSSTRITSSVFLSTRVGNPHRQFASKPWLLQEATQLGSSSSQPVSPLSEIPEAQRSKNARSVVALKVPKKVVRSDVEALFQKSGLEIVDLKMRMDRFTFYSDMRVFVELASEQQAQRAVELLNSNQTFGKPIYLRPVKPEFDWGFPDTFGEPGNDLGRFVFSNENGVATAIQPILEGRRLHVSVKTPAWGELKTNIQTRNRANREVVARTLSQFGVESIGPCSPNWGDLKQHPRFLCFADFKTKKGAEEAIRAIHDTEIQGRKVWLTLSEVPDWKAFQIGRVDKEKLTELQENGLASKEIDEERFSKDFVKRAPRQKRTHS